MNARKAAKIRAELREGLTAGRRHAEVVSHTGTSPRAYWTEHAPRHLDDPYTHGRVSGFKQRYKALAPDREAAAQTAREQAQKGREANLRVLQLQAKARQDRIDREARNPDLSFIQLYTEGMEVRVTTYLGGEHSSTILVDPDRAESLGHQFLTEAARARSKRNGANDGSSDSSGRRGSQQRVGETG